MEFFFEVQRLCEVLGMIPTVIDISQKYVSYSDNRLPEYFTKSYVMTTVLTTLYLNRDVHIIDTGNFRKLLCPRWIDPNSKSDLGLLFVVLLILFE